MNTTLPYRTMWHFMPFTIAAALFIVHPALAITGGQLDGDGHPNVGTFVLTKYENPNFSIELPNVCGSGTLIHPRVVLVAAHGVDFAEFEIESGFYGLEDLKFSFGADAKNPTTWRNISALVKDPRYNPAVEAGLGAIPQYDVGFVILEEPAEGIEPATLAPEGFLDALKALGLLRDRGARAPFTVVGFGHLLGDPIGILPPFTASTDGLRRTATSGFLITLDKWLFLNQNPARGYGGTQICDSGGPTFWVNPDSGDEILVAISSRGDARGVATGITYRIDTADSLEFIYSIVQHVEEGEW